MDIQTKITRAETEVRFLARADDTDSQVRQAALDRIAAFVAAERQAIGERVAARIAEQISAKGNAS